jgi:hypothetical protein
VVQGTWISGLKWFTAEIGIFAAFDENSLVNTGNCFGGTQAAVDGRLPRGVGIANLRDAPAEWSLQYARLGLAS